MTEILPTKQGAARFFRDVLKSRALLAIGNRQERTEALADEAARAVGGDEVTLIGDVLDLRVARAKAARGVLTSLRRFTSPIHLADLLGAT